MASLEDCARRVVGGLDLRWADHGIPLVTVLTAANSRQCPMRDAHAGLEIITPAPSAPAASISESGRQQHAVCRRYARQTRRATQEPHANLGASLSGGRRRSLVLGRERRNLATVRV